MKKLLYITVNSKPEQLSSSKKVGRIFINKFLEKHNEFQLEEIDLYNTHLPRLEYPYFEKRNCVVNKDDFNKLSEKDKEEVHTIVKLCDQFKEADIYVIAAPMWSLSFPAPLKEYLDCVIQDGKTIEINENKIIGLLEDKPRSFLYIQSSGGPIPWILKGTLNKGINYVEDLMKIVGIKKFNELLIDGTGFTQEEKEKAEKEAIDKIDSLVEKIWKETNE
ncbi:FMN-dependent NADH-azoreductase [Clostridium tarantellae]|uniref:FMN dependent NADH:quinone oxidoreductase n=1 Tax=Clostridium tarantellae TaxID=39493 RepID=A0A6I1MQ52_9CLOT|nr:NAD(P)H-dependent oxidoreductase [Clostridium tarantellae]MPQ44372.1 FMN-dependent NADH-azoreductase [Clostridium tarantellae]